MDKARPIKFIGLRADGKTNMVRSVGVIIKIISNSRVGKKKAPNAEIFVKSVRLLLVYK